MVEIKISVKYKPHSVVYLKTDTNQDEFIVIGYYIGWFRNIYTVVYNISNNGYERDVTEEEITIEKNILKAI